jgi:hypothetical protein
MFLTLLRDGAMTERPTLSRAILDQARQQPEGATLTAKALLHLGGRAAVDQALSRLARRGELVRIFRGLYVLPVEGRFGRRSPSVAKTVAALAAHRGEQIVASGATAANALGLTTQVPVRTVLLTSGRTRTLELGRQKVELRHAPRWQLALGDSRPGLTLRALAWLERDNAARSLDYMRQVLEPEERQSLAKIAAQLPDWLAAHVSCLVHD